MVHAVILSDQERELGYVDSIADSEEHGENSYRYCVVCYEQPGCADPLEYETDGGHRLLVEALHPCRQASCQAANADQHERDSAGGCSQPSALEKGDEEYCDEGTRERVASGIVYVEETEPLRLETTKRLSKREPGSYSAVPRSLVSEDSESKDDHADDEE